MHPIDAVYALPWSSHGHRYFICTTLLGLGYGDYTAITDYGKICMIVFFIFLLYFIPTRLHQLYVTYLKSLRKKNHDPFVNKSNEPTILLCGYMTYEDIKEKLDTMYKCDYESERYIGMLLAGISFSSGCLVGPADSWWVQAHQGVEEEVLFPLLDSEWKYIQPQRPHPCSDVECQIYHVLPWFQEGALRAWYGDDHSHQYLEQRLELDSWHLYTRTRVGKVAEGNHSMTESMKGSMFIEEEDSVFDQKVCKYSELQALHLYFNVFQLFDHSSIVFCSGFMSRVWRWIRSLWTSLCFRCICSL